MAITQICKLISDIAANPNCRSKQCVKLLLSSVTVLALYIVPLLQSHKHQPNPPKQRTFTNIPLRTEKGRFGRSLLKKLYLQISSSLISLCSVQNMKPKIQCTFRLQGKHHYSLVVSVAYIVQKWPEDCEAQTAITGKALSQNSYPTVNTAALTGPAVCPLNPLCSPVSDIVSHCPGLAGASCGESAPL